MNKKATLNLQERREIGQVLNATFAFIGITFKAMYRDILLIAGPFYALAGIFESLATYHIVFRPVETLGASSILALYQFFASPVYWLNILCLLIGVSMSFTIIANHVLQYKLHGPGYNVQEVRKNIRADLMRVIWANILNDIAIVIACVLFIIPGIYLAVANSLLTTILILERRIKTTDAFSESRRLVRDNWWATLGLGIIVGIIALAVQFIFKIPSTILTTIIKFNSVKNGEDAGSYETLYIALNALVLLSSAIVAPIGGVASCIYYYSLKEKKDHTSLMQNIDNIGVQQANPQTETQKDEGDF